ncbi:MAG: ComF family protein [Clostridiaceae bacterium]|jgi:ComF family protein|nr:ComF family protein [Clostridiaceae bacterium]
MTFFPPVNNLDRLSENHDWNILFPPVCCFCRRIDPAAQFPNICRRCLSALPLRFGADQQLDLPDNRCGKIKGNVPVYCAAFYQKPISDALIRMKFSDKPSMARALAALLRTVVCSNIKQVDGFVAVPLHKKRLAERGYNQAELMTRLLAVWLKKPDLSGGLIRKRLTGRQSEIKDREARLNNPRGAFALNPLVWQRWLNDTNKAPQNCHIVLVDDVLTTGATLNAAAQPLLTTGFTLSGLVVASNMPGRRIPSHASSRLIT